MQACESDLDIKWAPRDIIGELLEREHFSEPGYLNTLKLGFVIEEGR